MALKHTLVAGVAALSLLVTPVGLTVQWHGHGPAITATPAVSTALAAPSRPTPKKPPASGGPRFTHSGSVSKTTGWSTPGSKMSNAECESVANTYDTAIGEAIEADIAGDYANMAAWHDVAANVLHEASTAGCAFSGDMVPID